MKKVFIDGNVGTTGLEIVSKIKENSDLLNQIDLISIGTDERKVWTKKLECYRLADLIVLCLPDESSFESVRRIGQDKQISAKVLDTSTAHRTEDGWVYGFPELTHFKLMIQSARWVANPGCYATGMIAILRPLIEGELLPANTQINCSACSGYSGGGRKMIERYERGLKGEEHRFYTSCHPYAIDLDHKHLAEVKKISGLEQSPIFQPYVMGTSRGMLVSMPIKISAFKSRVSLSYLKHYYEEYYDGHSGIRIRLAEEESLVGGNFIDPTLNNQTNFLDLIISGRSEIVNLHARLDNLGKGASGAAIQNMKLMLGMT